MDLKTRALVAPTLHGPLEIWNIQLEPPRADEVLVEIQAVGICHAEISCLHGKLPVQFPNVFGHEGAGVVRETGSEVLDVKPGDKVLLSYNSCGHCSTCVDGNQAYCEHMWTLNFGGTRLDGSHTMSTQDRQPMFANYFGQSSFSNLAVVNRRCAVKVSEDTPLDLFAPLGCGIQTGAGAILNTLDVRPGSTVAIFGTGAVGMAAIMAAKIRKAKIIIGIDIKPSRLDLALELGATHVLDGSSENLTDQIKAICHPNGVSYAADTTGVPSIVEKMIQSLGTLGKAVTIGAPAPGSHVSIDVLSLLTMGRQYLGCNQGGAIPQRMIPYLLEQHSIGNLPVEKIVKKYNIEDHESAFADMMSGEVIKPVLLWRK